MIKALIIDDEPMAADVLRLLIERNHPEITEVLIETDAIKALLLLEKHQPQLLFLDIVMPEITGFDFLQKVSHKNFDIVFTTAFNEYAIQAIRFSAIDYLLKPINAEELNIAIKRHLEKQLGAADFESLYQNLLHNLRAKQTVNFKLAIPTVAGTLFVGVDELIRCEGESNYTCFHLANGRRHLSAKTIKEYEEILCGHGFIRVHKSHLINRTCIVNYLNEGAVLLKDNQKIPVSRLRKEAVKKILSIG